MARGAGTNLGECPRVAIFALGVQFVHKKQDASTLADLNLATNHTSECNWSVSPYTLCHVYKSGKYESAFLSRNVNRKPRQHERSLAVLILEMINYADDVLIPRLKLLNLIKTATDGK